jgi:GDPmannose 4,6-dehydratase
MAARHLGISIRWEGEGVDEKGINAETGHIMVAVDPRYFRPTEVQDLLGDAGKARKKLGWKPRITFEQLVAEMVEADMKEAQKDSLCQLEGFQTFNHFDT